MEFDGSAPAVLNATNEVVVGRFLKGKIAFDKITEIVEKTLNEIYHKKVDSISEALDFDKNARIVANNFN